MQRSASASSGASAVSEGGSSASASARARSTGGTATAIASATSNAFSEAKSELVVIYARIFNEYSFEDPTDDVDGWCTSAFSDLFEEFKAIGEVSAEAYASTEVVAEVDGEGEACADAEAAAVAQAEGYAEVVVDAILEAASNYPDILARVDAVVNAKIEVLVTAFAEAWSSACAGDDSSASAYQDSVASAFAFPICGVTLDLFAEVDCLTSDAFVDAYVEAFNYPADEVFAETASGAVTEGDATADAGGSAGATVEVRCSGLLAYCCRRSIRDLDTCTCTSSPNARCDVEKRDDLWYNNETGEECSC